MSSINDTRGLLDLINTINFVNIVYLMGKEHKLIEVDKTKEIKVISEKINPDGLGVINGIDVILTPLNLSTLNTNISIMDLTKITVLKNLLTENRVTLLNQFLKPCKADSSLDILNPSVAPLITNFSFALTVLENLNETNFLELVRASNLLIFFDSNGTLTPTNLDKFMQSCTSNELSNIKDDLTILSSSMPHFSTYSATLNETNLNSLISPNPSCSPCLTQFLNMTGLKPLIMGFLDTNFNQVNSFFNSELGKIQAEIDMYQSRLNVLSLRLNALENLNNSLLSLLSSLNDAVFSYSVNCTPVSFLISMLSAMQKGLNETMITPLKLNLAQLNLSIDTSQSFLNSMFALKNLMPHIDC